MSLFFLLRRLAFAVVTIALAGADIAAQDMPPLRIAELGTCPLVTGEVLPDCRLSYRLFGSRDPSQSDVVLIPTWFGGTSAAWAPYVGSQGYADTARFAVIVVDAFGAGESSSPTDSAWRGRAFPDLSLRDFVSAQRMLLQQLGVARLHAVVGISMGGEQALEWLASYPEVVSRAVAIVAATELLPYDRVQFEALAEATRTDSTLQQLARLLILSGGAPEATNARSPESANRLVASYAMAFRNFGQQNALLQARAILRHDATARLSARWNPGQTPPTVLLVNSPDDRLVTPQSARGLAKLPGVELIEVPSPCGHQIFVCERARIAPAVQAFLNR